MRRWRSKCSVIRSKKRLAHWQPRSADWICLSSDLSSDVKTLLDARGSNANAAMAVEMFCYQIKKAIGALAAALGGLDMLVFRSQFRREDVAGRAGIERECGDGGRNVLLSDQKSDWRTGSRARRIGYACLPISVPT